MTTVMPVSHIVCVGGWGRGVVKRALVVVVSHPVVFGFSLPPL